MMAGVTWFFLAACTLPVICVAQSGQLTCFQCGANNPQCSTTCVGRYCYKLELEIDGDKDKTLKTGCLNSLDGRAAVGHCSVTKGKLPGGGSDTTERYCVCDKAKCNTAGMVRPCSRSLMTMLAAIYATLTVVRQL